MVNANSSIRTAVADVYDSMLPLSLSLPFFHSLSFSLSLSFFSFSLPFFIFSLFHPITNSITRAFPLLSPLSISLFSLSLVLGAQGIHSIVEAFYPCMRGAEGLARTLFGEYNK